MADASHPVVLHECVPHPRRGSGVRVGTPVRVSLQERGLERHHRGVVARGQTRVADARAGLRPGRHRLNQRRPHDLLHSGRPHEPGHHRLRHPGSGLIGGQHFSQQPAHRGAVVRGRQRHQVVHLVCPAHLVDPVPGDQSALGMCHDVELLGTGRRQHLGEVGVDVRRRIQDVLRAVHPVVRCEDGIALVTEGQNQVLPGVLRGDRAVDQHHRVRTLRRRFRMPQVVDATDGVGACTDRDSFRTPRQLRSLRQQA